MVSSTQPFTRSYELKFYVTLIVYFSLTVSLIHLVFGINYIYPYRAALNETDTRPLVRLMGGAGFNN